MIQIVNVEASSVNMFPTKAEIKLRKKEPGSWSKLEIPRESKDEHSPEPITQEDAVTSQIDAVDLSDI